MFVTEDLKAAVADAEVFQKESKYGGQMCLNTVSGGVRYSTFETALNSCQNYITSGDERFYLEFFRKYSKPLCVLPRDHSGPCVCTYSKFFSKKFANKIKDCDTTPGNDDILFMNRARRTFPIQVTKRNYTVLNAKYRWKGNVRLRAANPVENAGTNFTVATAHYDFAAILMLQKGIEHTLPEEVKCVLLGRAQAIIEGLSKQGVHIVNKEGVLCDPVLGCTIQPEWYETEGGSDPNQVQFGHINPLRSDKYMTRGMNVVPITRRGNLIQSDTPLSKVHEFIKHAYQHTYPR